MAGENNIYRSKYFTAEEIDQQLLNVSTDIKAGTVKTHKTATSIQFSYRDNVNNEYITDIPAATTETAGVMTGEDKLKLNSAITSVDEDDFKVQSGRLEAASRNPEEGSLGYVVLKKNTSFDSQLAENTIIEVRYSFNLNNEEVELPTGCVLSFTGGSLNNGTIIANNAQIEAPRYTIFNNVNIGGEFDGEGCVEWFGGGVNISDNRDVLQKAINAFRQVRLGGLYKVESTDENGRCITVPIGHSIIGDKLGTITEHATNSGIKANFSEGVVLFLKSSTKLENIHINGSGASNNIIGIASDNTRSIVLNNVLLSNLGYGVKMNTFLTSVTRVEAWYNNIGFSFEGKSGNPYTSLSLNNCYAAYNKQVGYNINYMIYSTFNCCACDSTGKQPDGTIGNTDAVGYKIENSQNINLTNCGAEQNARLLYIGNSSHIKQESCNIQAEKVEELNANKYIEIDFSRDININHCSINLTKIGEDGEPETYTGKYVWLDVIYNTITLVSNCIPQSAVDGSNQGASGIDIYNTYVLTNNNYIRNNVTSEIKNNQSGIINVTTNNDYTLKFTAAASSPKYFQGTATFKDYTNNSTLIIEGTSEFPYDNAFQFNYRPTSFIGWKKIIFCNILFLVPSGWGGDQYNFMKFTDTDVEFVNCIFQIDGAKEAFGISNSTVSWVNTCGYIHDKPYNNTQSTYNFTTMANYQKYNNRSYVVLPPSTQVVIDDKSAVVVGKNVNLLYDGGIKYVDNSGNEIV